MMMRKRQSRASRASPTTSGEGNAVLKQLAYVKIDNVSEAMDGIIENTLLSDIIEVTEYTVAAYNTDTTYSENDQWLFEADPNYTENGKHYTFVYDGSGKYYMTDVIYLPATKSQLTGKTVIHFTYAPNTEFENVPALLSERGSNIYFASTENGKTVSIRRSLPTTFQGMTLPPCKNLSPAFRMRTESIA